MSRARAPAAKPAHDVVPTLRAVPILRADHKDHQDDEEDGEDCDPKKGAGSEQEDEDEELEEEEEREEEEQEEEQQEEQEEDEENEENEEGEDEQEDDGEDDDDKSASGELSEPSSHDGEDDVAAAASVLSSAQSLHTAMPFLAETVFNTQLPTYLYLLLAGQGVLVREGAAPSVPNVLLDLVASYACFPVPSVRQWQKQLSELREMAHAQARSFAVARYWAKEWAKHQATGFRDYSAESDRCVRALHQLLTSVELIFHRASPQFVAVVLRCPPPTDGGHASSEAQSSHAEAEEARQNHASSAASLAAVVPGDSFLYVNCSFSEDLHHGTQSAFFELRAFRTESSARSAVKRSQPINSYGGSGWYRGCGRGVDDSNQLFHFAYTISVHGRLTDKPDLQPLAAWLRRQHGALHDVSAALALSAARHFVMWMFDALLAESEERSRRSLSEYLLNGVNDVLSDERRQTMRRSRH